MKLIIGFLLTSILLSNNIAQEIRGTKSMKIMSYNIRCAVCEDSSSINHWSKRKQRVFQLIERYDPDIIGLQEAEIGQINDIVNHFKGFKWIGKGRDDGKEAGEFTAVLYKENRFLLDSTDTYWLSSTPSIPSKGWDAAYKRTITIGLLKDLRNENTLCLLNTHFDHIGEAARIESAKLLRRYVQEYSSDYAAVITGDFNFTEDSRGYKALTNDKPGPDSLYPDMENDPLVNSQYISEQPHAGGNITFNGFGEATDNEMPIDFIFVNEKVKVISHQFITWLPEGLFPSDHFPVLVEILVK